MDFVKFICLHLFYLARDMHGYSRAAPPRIFSLESRLHLGCGLPSRALLFFLRCYSTITILCNAFFASDQSFQSSVFCWVRELLATEAHANPSRDRYVWKCACQTRSICLGCKRPNWFDCVGVCVRWYWLTELGRFGSSDFVHSRWFEVLWFNANYSRWSYHQCRIWINEAQNPISGYWKVVKFDGRLRREFPRVIQCYTETACIQLNAGDLFGGGRGRIKQVCPYAPF